MKYIKKFEKTDDYHAEFIDYIRNNNYKMVKRMIDLGDIDINHQTVEGKTPLMFACDLVNGWNIIDILIAAGADLYLKDIYEYDAFDMMYNKYKNRIKDKYPEKYKEYEIKQDSEKYNL